MRLSPQSFKTGALNHSATLPLQQHQSPGGPKIKNGLATWAQFGPKRFRLIYPSRRKSNRCKSEKRHVRVEFSWRANATTTAALSFRGQFGLARATC
jgi:hypothetical protein